MVSYLIIHPSNLRNKNPHFFLGFILLPDFFVCQRLSPLRIPAFDDSILTKVMDIFLWVMTLFYLWSMSMVFLLIEHGQSICYILILKT